MINKILNTLKKEKKNRKKDQTFRYYFNKKINKYSKISQDTNELQI